MRWWNSLAVVLKSLRSISRRARRKRWRSGCSIGASLRTSCVKVNLHYAAANPFDAIYEQTCLCAIAPKDWAAYEQRLHVSLRTAGKLYALFMQTDAPAGPPFHCDLDAMKELFHDSRWLWTDEQFTVDHPTGMKEIAVVLTKKGILD